MCDVPKRSPMRAWNRSCASERAHVLCESVLFSCSGSVLLSCSNSPSWPSRSRCRVSAVTHVLCSFVLTKSTSHRSALWGGTNHRKQTTENKPPKRTHRHPNARADVISEGAHLRGCCCQATTALTSQGSGMPHLRWQAATALASQGAGMPRYPRSILTAALLLMWTSTVPVMADVMSGTRLISTALNAVTRRRRAQSGSYVSDVPRSCPWAV